MEGGSTNLIMDMDVPIIDLEFCKDEKKVRQIFVIRIYYGSCQRRTRVFLIGLLRATRDYIKKWKT